MLGAIEAIAAAHAAAAAGFSLVCAVASRAMMRAGRDSGARPRVVLLRPAEALTAALATRLEQDAFAYSGELRRVACVARGGAAPAGVQVALSGLSDDAVVNRKAAHLQAGYLAARDAIDDATVVVHADSDVALLPGDLDALVGSLVAGDEPCLAFAPPAPSGGTRFAQALAQSVVSLSPQSFAVIAALAGVTRGAPAIAGKLVAMPAPLLRAVGGYECMMHSIGDDVALVEAAARAGARDVMSPRAAVTIDDSRTPGSVAAQLARWLRVVGSHRPQLLLTYPLFIAPLAVAVLLTTLARSPVAWLSLSALVASRALLSIVLARGPYRGRVRWASVLLAPLGDALLIRAALLALTAGRIEWSGRRYRVGSGGRILAVESTGARPEP